MSTRLPYVSSRICPRTIDDDHYDDEDDFDDRSINEYDNSTEDKTWKLSPRKKWLSGSDSDPIAGSDSDVLGVEPMSPKKKKSHAPKSTNSGSLMDPAPTCDNQDLLVVPILLTPKQESVPLDAPKRLKSGRLMFPVATFAKPKPRGVNAGVPRVMARRINVPETDLSIRNKKLCPLENCGRSYVNVKQHLLRCHQTLTLQEISKLLIAEC